MRRNKIEQIREIRAIIEQNPGISLWALAGSAHMDLYKLKEILRAFSERGLIEIKRQRNAICVYSNQEAWKVFELEE